MPTVFRFEGLRVVIYPADHRPAHVHVIGAKGEAVLNLNCRSGPPELRQSYGFSLPEVNHSRNVLEDHLIAPCAEWRKIHGRY